MKNITDFILESMSSYEEKIEKWWDKNRTTAPSYCIKKSSKPLGMIKITGKPIIYRVKQVNADSQFDDKVSVGGHGYEMYVTLSKEQLLSEFKEPKWTPFAYTYDADAEEYIKLFSWDQIIEYVNEKSFEGTLYVYKGPQPKE